MQNISDWEIPPAKARSCGSAKFGLTIFFAAPSTFLACFASLRLCSGHALREIFRIFGCGFAALGFFLVLALRDESLVHKICAWRANLEA